MATIVEAEQPKPEVATTVVVVPEPAPVEKPSETPDPASAIDAVLETVTSLELTKPELEPEPELVQEQATHWMVTSQTESAANRRARSRSLSSFFWLR